MTRDVTNPEQDNLSHVSHLSGCRKHLSEALPPQSSCARLCPGRPKCVSHHCLRDGQRPREDENADCTTNKPQTRPLLPAHEDEGDGQASPRDKAEPSQRRPARRLVANVLFPYVQLTEMLNTFPFQLSSKCRTRVSLTGSPSVAALLSTQTEGNQHLTEAVPASEQFGGEGSRDGHASPRRCSSSPRTDLTAHLDRVGCPEQGGVLGVQCAWRALQRCCHLAREDTDTSANMGPLPSAVVHPHTTTMARACLCGRPWPRNRRSRLRERATADQLCEQAPSSADRPGRAGPEPGDLSPTPSAHTYTYARTHMHTHGCDTGLGPTSGDQGSVPGAALAPSPKAGKDRGAWGRGAAGRRHLHGNESHRLLCGMKVQPQRCPSPHASWYAELPRWHEGQMAPGKVPEVTLRRKQPPWPPGSELTDLRWPLLQGPGCFLRWV